MVRNKKTFAAEIRHDPFLVFLCRLIGLLHQRLVDRKREPPEVIERRFAEAKSEIAAARSSDVYDALVVNDDLERATAELHTLIERRLQTLRNG